jgi:hypothetical protein
MFLFAAPNAANVPLFQIEWPYYLIGFDIGCLVMFTLIYLPFWFTRREEIGADAWMESSASDRCG